MTEQLGFYADKDGKFLRDSLGHTHCAVCGKVVSRRTEDFSIRNYKKILCFNCQKKGGDK